ncbi:MAG: hypothetical protein IT355_14735 [Gemmatimonadaceae bacterium]|nr:hypothetical protein [Gemmatimonadaceae bacterium]
MSVRTTSGLAATLISFTLISFTLVACADATAPAADAAPLLKGGSGSGGGGASVGQIQAVSGIATCDKGSRYAITVRKGFQKRAELVTTASASPVPTGPAIAPGTLRGTSIGGYTTFTMRNDASGALLYGHAAGYPYAAPSYTQTESAGTLPVGTTPIRFEWINQQLDGVTFQPDLSTIPVYETCTLVLNVVAR